MFVDETVVVLPDTVKLPVTVMLPATLKPSPPPISTTVESLDLITLPAILIEPAVRSLTPAIVVALPPKLIDVVPTVTAELERLELPMFDNVFELPDMVLFVSVSVVALPTNVSVDVGKVIVPVFDIDDITGVVKVLFESV